MQSLRLLVLLPLAALVALLVACKSGTSGDTGVVEVRDVDLTHITSEEAVRELRKKLGSADATVSANTRNNSVIVTGTTAQVEHVVELVADIDVPPK